MLMISAAERAGGDGEAVAWGTGGPPLIIIIIIIITGSTFMGGRTLGCA